MKHLFCTLLFCLPLTASSFAQTNVIDLRMEQSSGTIEGNLSQGFEMPLRWAESSQIACFPATRFNEFRGHHLLYRIPMPAYAEMKITLSPKDRKYRINLYALRLGINNVAVPPDISSAISCEASYPLYAGTPNLGAPSEPQSVEFISIRKGYNIVIGVAGAEGVTEGDFELRIDIEKRK